MRDNMDSFFWMPWSVRPLEESVFLETTVMYLQRLMNAYGRDFLITMASDSTNL